MLTCHTFTELADRHIDEELDWWTGWRVRRHLRICRYCRYFLGQMTTTRQLIRNAFASDQPIPGEAALVEALKQTDGE